MIPKFCLFDSSWMQDEVIRAMRNATMQRVCGRKRDDYFLPILGRGSGQIWQPKTYESPAKIGSGVIEIGNKWHMRLNKRRRSFDIFADVDFWKMKAQAAFKLPRGARGSISLFSAPDATHKTFRRHMVNESINVVVEPEKGAKKKYLRTGDNRYLDCLVYGLVALDRAGFRTYLIPQEEIDQRIGSKTPRNVARVV